MYPFLFIALLSFLSLSMLSYVAFVESPSKSAIECVEQKNNVVSETTDTSHLSCDLNFARYESQSDITYQDKIYSLLLSDNRLRPPISS